MAGRRRRQRTVKAPPMTAVIYARFSSSKQREASIEDQLRVCRAWCAREGHEVVAEYCDRAASGRTDERAEFQRMVSNAGEAEVCVVYMMDRFSRDVYDAPIYKKRLRDRGCRVVSATESMPDGPESMLMESIYEAMAAMESAHTSQRTRRGMEGNALKCMHNGVYLYGYDLGDDGMYHVNEAQAENVRLAFALRASGKSIGVVARELADRGVTSYRGRPCTYGMAQSMLRNEKYAGTYSWGGVRVEGGMPAIVSMEEFEMAQGIRSAKRRHEEDWTDFAFSGRGVCGRCGMNLVGDSGRGRNNVKYTYYRCSQRCGARAVRADWLEESVAGALRRLLSGERARRELADAVREAMSLGAEEAEEESIRAELPKVRAGIENLARAVEQGMPYDMAASRISQLRDREAHLEARLVVLSQRDGFDPDSFVEFLASSDGLDDRTLLDALVWQVQLHEDRVVAVLNYDVDSEPARIEIPTGSEKLAWLPTRDTIRNTTEDDTPLWEPESRVVELGGGAVAYLCRGMVCVAVSA